MRTKVQQVDRKIKSPGSTFSPTKQGTLSNNGQQITDGQAGLYNDMDKSQLIRLIINRDKDMTNLQNMYQDKLTKESEKIEQYKLKLQQEISQNQKAVKAFASITQIIISIISKFQGFQKINRESVATLVDAIRQSLGDSGKTENGNINNADMEPHSSQYSCLDQIIDQSIKLLQYLGKLTEDSLNINSDMRKNLKNLKLELNSSANLGKSKIPVDQQILLLKNELNKKILQVTNLQKLLAQQQQQRKKLIGMINTCLEEEKMQKLGTMDREELIEYIKKLGFKIKELEKDKRDSFAKNRIEREEDYRKMQILLREVKLIKSNQALYRSAS